MTIFRLLCATALLGTLAVSAQAEESNSAIVHRQSLYKVAAGHMSGLKASLLLKDGPAANAAYHAEGIVAAYQHFGDAWPAGSDKGETKAKANIWSDRAGFDKLGKESYAAALAMVEAAKTGDQGKSVAAFKTLGGTCKACHEEYRKD